MIPTYLIYERIREERRGGRSLIQAIDAGFQRAFSTILDANITTLIAAVILFYLGSGPVRGFAVTLAIGIMTTVFTAFTVTRWMIAEWVRRKRPKVLPNGLLTNLFQNAHYKFMWLRKIAFSASAAAALASLIGFGTVGMNYGIDFTGGNVFVVEAKSGSANVGDIRSRLSDLNLGDIQVTEFDSSPAGPDTRAGTAGRRKCGTKRNCQGACRSRTGLQISSLSNPSGQSFRVNWRRPVPLHSWRRFCHPDLYLVPI